MAQQKILLLEDVNDLGRKGDIQNVKPGFARNFLFPKGKAVIADKNAIRMQERLQEERRKQAELDRQEAEAVAAKINGQTLSTEVKVDHEGHMYGSVTQQDVLSLIEKDFNVELEKRAAKAIQPIKKTGVYDLTIHLKEGVTAEMKIKVIPEGGTLEEETNEENTAEVTEEDTAE